MTRAISPRAPRGDEADLYRQHHRRLVRAVGRSINAPPALIEDACQNAWVILLRSQPDRATVFPWLRVVALNQARRLAAVQRREIPLANFDLVAENHAATADESSLDDALEARDALRLLDELPPRQRADLALKIAGFSYREICQLTGGRTYTNVNKHLSKARARIRQAKRQETGATPARHASV